MCYSNHVCRYHAIAEYIQTKTGDKVGEIAALIEGYGSVKQYILHLHRDEFIFSCRFVGLGIQKDECVKFKLVHDNETDSLDLAVENFKKEIGYSLYYMTYLF